MAMDALNGAPMQGAPQGNMMAGPQNGQFQGQPNQFNGQPNQMMPNQGFNGQQGMPQGQNSLGPIGQSMENPNMQQGQFNQNQFNGNAQGPMMQNPNNQFQGNQQVPTNFNPNQASMNFKTTAIAASAKFVAK